MALTGMEEGETGMSKAIAASFAWDTTPDDAHRAVVSELALFFGTETGAKLTIAIPTYQREDLLVETIRSVIAQTRLNDVVVIVIDNDASSEGYNTLLARIPELATIRFRYYRNPANVGMFGNWNKCIDLCSTPWLSILNDDDLLDPDFTASMLDFVDRHSDVDAAICSKRWIDQRDGNDVVMHEEDGAGRKILGRLRFGNRGYRRITPRSLFFGNVIGNSVGLIVRTTIARKVGGFRAAEFPSADYYFNVRLARIGHLSQLRRVLASVRIAQNESCKPETVMGFLSQGRDLQLILAKDMTPRWWGRLIPQLLRIAIDDVNALWRTHLAPSDVAAALRTSVPQKSSRLLKIMRNILPDI